MGRFSAFRLAFAYFAIGYGLGLIIVGVVRDHSIYLILGGCDVLAGTLLLATERRGRRAHRG